MVNVVVLVKQLGGGDGDKLADINIASQNLMLSGQRQLLEGGT